MAKIKVGEIQNYDVIYIPERDIIFCKNTTISFPAIEKIIRSNEDKGSIPEKELTILKDNGVVHLGCLVTTMDNCLEIIRQVRKAKV